MSVVDRIAELDQLLPTAQSDAQYANWAAEREALLRESAAASNGDGGRHGPRELTELGNAERLLERRGDDLQYCPPLRGGWFTWDGRRWRDDKPTALRWSAETARSIRAEAERAEDPELRKRLLRHADRSETARSVAATLELAGPKITKPVEAFDANPFELTVRNASIDLGSGEPRAHDRKRLSTRLVDVDYDPDATCPLWQQFLARAFDGDDELIGFVRRAVGYSLTGSTREQVLFLLHGGGSNGKSVLVETIRALAGEYATQTPASTLLEGRHGSDAIPNDLARLRAVRLVTAAETGDGRRLNEERVKALTGSDTISARFLHREWFDFQPSFKLWLSTNHLPNIRGTDHAIWRRIRKIPFTVTIPADEQDRDLPLKLRGELPGILAWAVAGCLEWQRDGLGSAKAVDDATTRYREDMDTLGDFIEARCIVEQGAHETVGNLYAAYQDWASATGVKPVTEKRLAMALEERGFSAERKKINGRTVRRRLGLELANGRGEAR